MNWKALIAGSTLTLVAWAVVAETVQSTDLEQLRSISYQYVEQHKSGADEGARKSYSAESFLAEIAEQRQLLERLTGIDPSNMSLEQDIDRRLLIGITRSDINTAETLRRWENDASIYLPSAAIGRLLEPESAGTSEQRVSELTGLMNALPGMLAAGVTNLKRPPRRFTEAALFQTESTLRSLDEGVSQFPQLDDATLNLTAQTRKSLQDYHRFLSEDLLPRSDGQWMLGREAYDFILQQRWYMKADAEQIRQRGLSAFEQTSLLAQQVADRIQPGKHWTEVYESLKDDHPQAATIKQAYQQQMDAARVFVLKNSVVTLPAGEQVITLDTPAAMRRSSPFGTFQPASPFEMGLEGRLYLTPIESWMSADQQARRLRSHHTTWIPIIAVHEAYPGHHAQALIVNENPNVLRRVVSESIFTEGWGLFTEELMFELGFLQGDEIRLTQLRNRIWRAARVILDVSLHTGLMSFDEAVSFLVEKVRFEPYAAELEVGMYIRNPTYVLGYLIGMQEIEAIRAEFIERYGQPKPPSVFYDRLLRIGSIPPSLLREELFARPPQSD